MENSARSKDFKADSHQLLQVFQHCHHLAVLQQRYTNGGNKFVAVQHNDKDAKCFSM